MRIQDAQATVPEDLNMIFNMIAGRPARCARVLTYLGCRARPMTHPAYDRMNAQLQGLFAMAGWPQLLNDPEQLAKCSSRLAASGAYRLVQSFRSCTAMTDDTARLLARSLPSTLVEVKLELVDSGATPEGGAALLDGVIQRVQLHALCILDMNDCMLHCALPKELGKCGKLEVLAFAGNRMTGSIPPELGLCTQLRQLKLQNNRLDGPVPEELGQCVHLTLVRLNGNQLEGVLPASLGRCTELKELRIHANQLSGTLSALAECAALVELSCDKALLAEPLPDGLREREQAGEVKTATNLDDGSARPACLSEPAPRQLFIPAHHVFACSTLSHPAQLCLNKPRSNAARGHVLIKADRVSNPQSSCGHSVSNSSFSMVAETVATTTAMAATALAATAAAALTVTTAADTPASTGTAAAACGRGSEATVTASDVRPEKQGSSQLGSEQRLAAEVARLTAELTRLTSIDRAAESTHVIAKADAELAEENARLSAEIDRLTMENARLQGKILALDRSRGPAEPEPTPALYCNLTGKFGLASYYDPAWKVLQHPGVSAGLSFVTDGCYLANAPNSLTFPDAEGFRVGVNEDGRFSYELQDSDVVCFKSAPADADGYHSLVPYGHLRMYALPLATVTLEKVQQPGEWEVCGQFVRRRLLTVSITYK